MSQTANNLLRVSITGIDGAGKDTGTKLALQKVAAAGIAPIVKVVRPMYVINADGVETQIYKSWKEFTDTVHEFADKTRQKCAILGANALDVMVQSRFIEPAALRANPDAKVLASSRDMRVDPAVYSEFYCTMFAKRMSMKKRLQAAQFMTGISRDLIVRLVVDPKTAVKRIDERIAREAAEKEQSGVAGMRDKWRHMHENPDDLQKLDAAYAMALKVLSEYSSTEILEIDTNDMTREEVAEQVADKITKSYNLKNAAK